LRNSLNSSPYRMASWPQTNIKNLIQCLKHDYKIEIVLKI
jgi:hypothetical protein